MVEVLLFGSIAEALGRRSIQVPPGLSLSGLIRQAGCADLPSVLVAVNQVQVHDMDYVVQDGDEVALMPPFSGG